MVLETIRNPENVVKGYKNRKITQKMIGDKLLRAIYEKQENSIEVITAYLTSKIGKYR